MFFLKKGKLVREIAWKIGIYSSYFSEVEYPEADLPVDEEILHLKEKLHLYLKFVTPRVSPDLMAGHVQVPVPPLRLRQLPERLVGAHRRLRPPLEDVGGEEVVPQAADQKALLR